MKKLAVIVVASLLAFALHAGAMAGFTMLGALTDAHAAQGADGHHAQPLPPSCPIGNICPSLSGTQPDAFSAALAVIFVFVALAYAIPVASPRVSAPAPAPPFRFPNDPKFLLAVLKRE